MRLQKTRVLGQVVGRGIARRVSNRPGWFGTLGEVFKSNNQELYAEARQIRNSSTFQQENYEEILDNVPRL
jgi:hypothetical protein